MKKSQKGERGFSLLELLIVSVVLVIVLGIISAIVQSVNTGYARQRPRMEAVNNASAAMDIVVRLLRMAGNNPNNITNFPSTALPAIAPASNTIRIRSDWNPADGDLNDAFEDVEFTTGNGVLLKQDRSAAVADTEPVQMFENVESLSFTYFDINNAVTTNGNSVATVGITLTTRTPDGSPMSFSSTVSVRRMER